MKEFKFFNINMLNEANVPQMKAYNKIKKLIESGCTGSIDLIWSIDDLLRTTPEADGIGFSSEIIYEEEEDYDGSIIEMYSEKFNISESLNDVTAVVCSNIQKAEYIMPILCKKQNKTFKNLNYGKSGRYIKTQWVKYLYYDTQL